jgi:hypothetical protein
MRRLCGKVITTVEVNDTHHPIARCDEQKIIKTREGKSDSGRACANIADGETFTT